MSDRIKMKPRVARQHEISQAHIENNSINGEGLLLIFIWG